MTKLDILQKMKDSILDKYRKNVQVKVFVYIEGQSWPTG